MTFEFFYLDFFNSPAHSGLFRSLDFNTLKFDFKVLKYEFIFAARLYFTKYFSFTETEHSKNELPKVGKPP